MKDAAILVTTSASFGVSEVKNKGELGSILTDIKTPCNLMKPCIKKYDIPSNGHTVANNTQKANYKR